MTIVIAKRGNADTQTRGWRAGEVRAALYVRTGGEHALAAAKRQFEPDGWTVFTYSLDEAGRAKRDLEVVA